MFVGNAGAYPRVEHLKGASLGKTPAVSADIRQGLKGLQGTNALAYYEKAYLMDVKNLLN
jgi:hypothetical protein